MSLEMSATQELEDDRKEQSVENEQLQSSQNPWGASVIENTASNESSPVAQDENPLQSSRGLNSLDEGESVRLEIQVQDSVSSSVAEVLPLVSGGQPEDSSPEPNAHFERLSSLRAINSAPTSEVLPRQPDSRFNLRLFISQFLLHLFLPLSIFPLWFGCDSTSRWKRQCINQRFILPDWKHPRNAIMVFLLSWFFPTIFTFLAFTAVYRASFGLPMYDGWDAELGLLLIVVTVQRGMVAFKYGFLTDEEFEVFSQHPDFVTVQKWNYNLQLATAWANPPCGVVTQELQLSAQRQGIPLGSIFFTVDRSTALEPMGRDAGAGSSSEPELVQIPCRLKSLCSKKAPKTKTKPTEEETNSQEWEHFFDFKQCPTSMELATIAHCMTGMRGCVDDVCKMKKVPCAFMCTQLLFRSTAGSPVYTFAQRKSFKVAMVSALTQIVVAPLWRKFVRNGNAYEDDPWLLAFQVLQIPCLLVFLTTINNFLNVGLLEYIRLAIMMRDLGAMIDTKFDYKPPPSLLLRKPPPRLDLYKYPSNILSWCATWLIMDDFGRLFNNRLQFCSIFCCLGVVVAAANSMFVYMFEGPKQLRGLLMPYQAFVLGFWLSLILLWIAAIGVDLNKQQVHIRNKLLKQQLLSRMDDDEEEGETVDLLSNGLRTSIGSSDSMGSMNQSPLGRNSPAQAKGGNLRKPVVTSGMGAKRKRRVSGIMRSTMSEVEMNKMQDLLVVSMELLEQESPKRVAGFEATSQLISSAAVTLITFAWVAIKILFF